MILIDQHFLSKYKRTFFSCEGHKKAKAESNSNFKCFIPQTSKTSAKFEHKNNEMDLMNLKL